MIGGTSSKYAARGDGRMWVVEWFEPTYSAEHAWQQSGAPLPTKQQANNRATSLRHQFQQDGCATEIRVRPV